MGPGHVGTVGPGGLDAFVVNVSDNDIATVSRTVTLMCMISCRTENSNTKKRTFAILKRRQNRSKVRKSCQVQ